VPHYSIDTPLDLAWLIKTMPSARQLSGSTFAAGEPNGVAAVFDDDFKWWFDGGRSGGRFSVCHHITALVDGFRSDSITLLT